MVTILQCPKQLLVFLYQTCSSHSLAFCLNRNYSLSVAQTNNLKSPNWSFCFPVFKLFSLNAAIVSSHSFAQKSIQRPTGPMWFVTPSVVISVTLSLLILLLHFRHTDLFVVPQALQAHSCFTVSVFALPSHWMSQIFSIIQVV